MTDRVAGPVAFAAAGPAESLLSVAGVAKAFGATRALRSCSFDLRPGEIHAIAGENGSGKSTLVKILSGVHRPDAGTLHVGEQPTAWYRRPRAAQEAGIVTVFQEVLVVATRSVLENVWLGVDGVFRECGTDADKRRRAEAVLGQLLGASPPLDVPVESLGLSDRQALCVARALLRDPKVLILDESTSALDVATRDRLFRVVRRLCAGGAAVVFISHRMDEVKDLADRVTVLRSGESVATLARVEASTEVLITHMTGEEQLTAGVGKVPCASRVRPEVRLRAEGLQLQPASEPIDFELRSGELVGVAGLEGHGQDAFLHALRGAGAYAGRVLALDGNAAAIDSPRDAFRGGVAYVPRDRRTESLFPSLSIAENFAMPTLPADARGGLLRWRAMRRRLDTYVERLGIRLMHPGHPIAALSGGNQQKVVVARWLAASPRVLLLNDPTRGVDLAAKRDLYALLEELTSQGVGVVMLSTELDEHVELMDRVLVFREGSLSCELQREQLDRRSLVGAFFGRPEARDG